MFSIKQGAQCRQFKYTQLHNLIRINETTLNASRNQFYSHTFSEIRYKALLFFFSFESRKHFPPGRRIHKIIINIVKQRISVN